MRAYADTNLLTGLFLRIGQHLVAEELVAQGKASGMDAMPVTELLRVELGNAFQLHVFLSRTTGQWRVSPETAGAAFAQFEEDLVRAQFLEAADLNWPDLRSAAVELSLRHTAQHGFRTYDLLHVAAALLLGCDTFWSFDAKARRLAEFEGLSLNPMP